jgi:hypothetical protein
MIDLAEKHISWQVAAEGIGAATARSIAGRVAE